MADLVEAGKMHKVVVFEKNIPITQGAGKKDVWSAIETTRGYLEKRGGHRLLDSGQKVFDNSWKLICRFNSTLEGQLGTNTVRVLIESKYYTVGNWTKVDERRQYYQFELSQHGN